MVSIGDRLRDEREALGLTQEKMAIAVGITKKTQGLYERDERVPDAEYLAAVAAKGVDVLYVVTGHVRPRLSAVSTTTRLTSSSTTASCLIATATTHVDGDRIS